MGRPSKVARLPKEVRASIEDAFDRGDTLDDILAALTEEGIGLSRSALGRRRKQHANLRERLAQTRQAAEAVARDFGAVASDGQGRLLIEMLQTIIFQVTQTETPDAKETALLARALRDLAGAKDKLLDLETRIRQEVKVETANAIRAECKSKGLSPEVAAVMRKIIEGEGEGGG